MGLHLKDLVELALLDSVSDQSITLDAMLGAGAPWHELSDRRDVQEMMAVSMHRMLADEEIVVREGEQGNPLVGSEAAMVLRRAAQEPGLSAEVIVTITETGKSHYHKLAKSYYNN